MDPTAFTFPLPVHEGKEKDKDKEAEREIAAKTYMNEDFQQRGHFLKR